MIGDVVLVVGGTSEARELCQILEKRDISYILTVATTIGAQQSGVTEGAVKVGRLDEEQFISLLHEQAIRWVIDASHPYAEKISRNLVSACHETGVPLLRYERKKLIDLVDNRLIHKVETQESAAELAIALGERVLLTTGSKTLAFWCDALKEKTIIARVLPVSDVLSHCESLGLRIDQIIAMCGPFSQRCNEAHFSRYRADVVITKESGSEGGFLEKITACEALSIPCIVIMRPTYFRQDYSMVIHSYEQFEECLQRLK